MYFGLQEWRMFARAGRGLTTYAQLHVMSGCADAACYTLAIQLRETVEEELRPRTSTLNDSAPRSSRLIATAPKRFLPR